MGTQLYWKTNYLVRDIWRSLLFSEQRSIAYCWVIGIQDKKILSLGLTLLPLWNTSNTINAQLDQTKSESVDANVIQLILQKKNLVYILAPSSEKDILLFTSKHPIVIHQVGITYIICRRDTEEGDNRIQNKSTQTTNYNNLEKLADDTSKTDPNTLLFFTWREQVLLWLLTCNPTMKKYKGKCFILLATSRKHSLERQLHCSCPATPFVASIPSNIFKAINLEHLHTKYLWTQMCCEDKCTWLRCLKILTLKLCTTLSATLTI